MAYLIALFLIVFFLVKCFTIAFRQKIFKSEPYKTARSAYEQAKKQYINMCDHYTVKSLQQFRSYKKQIERLTKSKAVLLKRQIESNNKTKEEAIQQMNAVIASIDSTLYSPKILQGILREINRLRASVGCSLQPVQYRQGLRT